MDINKRLGKVKHDCSLRVLKVYRQLKRVETENRFHTWTTREFFYFFYLFSIRFILRNR